MALPPLFQNTLRPLWPARSIGWTGIQPRSILIESRDAQYFAMRPELLRPYRSAVQALARRPCLRAALVAGYDSWEYPLWALGRTRALGFTHRESATARAERAPPPGDERCAMVVLDHAADWRPGHLPPDAEPIFWDAAVRVWP